MWQKTCPFVDAAGCVGRLGRGGMGAPAQPFCYRVPVLCEPLGRALWRPAVAAKAVAAEPRKKARSAVKWSSLTVWIRAGKWPRMVVMA